MEIIPTPRDHTDSPETFSAKTNIEKRRAEISGENTTRKVVGSIVKEMAPLGVKGLEFISQKFGETVGNKIYEFLRIKTERFDTDIVGLENIMDLSGSFIVAPNHTRPDAENIGGKIALSIGAHPDAVMIERIIREAKNSEVGVVSKGDPGEWGSAALETKKNILRPIMTGVVRGLGFIPVGLLPGSFNRELVERIGEDVESDKPILIFPEGRSYDEFSSTNEFKTGAAHFSIKHGIPIVPTYIKDCRDWSAGSKNSVIFGKPIYPCDMDKEDLTESVRQSVINLSSEAENL